MIDLSKAPFPVSYRELWLPRAINNNATLPTSVRGGQGLTLTGAQKRTSCDGVQFNGAATSNINCGAINNGQAQFGMSFRFKLDQAFAAAVATQYLWGKYIDADNYIRLYLDTADGLLHLKYRSAAVDLFDISVGTGTFTARTWYHVYFAIGQTIVGGAASDGARLRLDAGTAATNANATALPAGGDFVIGDYDDPGAGTGFQGVIADVFAYTDNVTLAEETNIYEGAPNTDAVHVYLLDEGRGTTANDRGSGANNGTLDTSATWVFGQVKQAMLSLDAQNDHAQSSSGVDIHGNFTMVWVGKMKSTYTGLSGNNRNFVRFFITGANQILFWYNQAGNAFQWRCDVGGAAAFTTIPSSYKPAIDDYLIMIGIIAGTSKFFINGSLVGSAATSTFLPATAATVYIGSDNGPGSYDISNPLLIAMIEGAFSDKQALAYSRWLKDVFNLPISV